MNWFSNISKEKLQKIVLVGIVTLGTMGGTAQFYVVTQCRSYFDSLANRERLKAQIVEAQQRQQTMDGKQQLAEKLREFVNAQQATMPQGDAFAWAVREISLLVEKHAVHVLSMRPSGDSGRQTPDKQNATYTTGLEVTGNYDQLGNLIKAIENHFPTAEIRSLEIAGGDASAGTHQMNLELAFRVRPERSVPKVGKKVTS